MDSLLLFGGQDKKLSQFLEKMGYHLTVCGPDSTVNQSIEGESPDLIIIDSRLDIDPVELCEYLRKHERTKLVPIVFLSDHRVHQLKLAELPKIQTIDIPYKIGLLASKIATELRLRKFAGADESTASIGEINARLRDLNDRFQKQLDEAREIQFSLVPNSLPRSDYFDICASYEPLEEVGGDWFYIRMLDNSKLSVQIADVTGHGLSAAFIASITKLALMAANKELPNELLEEMNRLMAPCIPAGKFVTMFSYLYDPDTGTINYARAGHPPALLVKRNEGVVKHLAGDGFAVGFFDDSEYAANSEQMDIGDILMVYTDAIPESQNMAGQTYDYQRMGDILLNSSPSSSSAEILRSVLDDFDQFRDGRILKDDVTAIVLKRIK